MIEKRRHKKSDKNYNMGCDFVINVKTYLQAHCVFSILQCFRKKRATWMRSIK